MEKETLQYTLRQYIHGKLSEEDSRKFLSYIKSGKDSILLQEIIQEVLDDPIDQYLLDDPAILAVLDSTWDQLDHHINKSEIKLLRSWKRIGAIAASIIGLLAIGQWFFNAETDNSAPPAIQHVISPGKQSATLTLANGKQIHLHETHNGRIVEESGIRISKTTDGQLIYEVSSNTQGEIEQNTLSTTKGECYRIKLPDGTQVWLNAASSLRYPVRFSKGSNRTVVLTGEAYFEVAKDSKHPFIVKTANQEVKVLGTHFNVNSYADESAVQTTLLEGRVQVSSHNQKLLLAPGEQSSLTAHGMLKSHPIDTAPVIAWTNNEFMFDGDDIESVMRKVARWYNVEVIYQGKKTTEKFGGGISRFDDVQKVLRLLEKTGAVHFRIDGKKIHVLP